jgi:hypothetical protein
LEYQNQKFCFSAKEPYSYLVTDNSGQPVIVDLPEIRRPSGDLDRLIQYLEGPFLRRKEETYRLIALARSLTSKEDVVRLGYAIVLFRGELDEWVRLAEQLRDDEFSDQLDQAHGERSEEAAQQGSTRPSAKLVEQQAKKFTSPLRRAYGILSDTRDWLDRTLYFVGAQQRLIAAEEYGDVLSGRQAAPDDLFASEPPTGAPSVTSSLRQDK